jgi:hypothetical protein
MNGVREDVVIAVIAFLEFVRDIELEKPDCSVLDNR